MRTMSISLRALFLIGFVLAMPILALPAVARRVDDWLYGAVPTDFPTPTATASTQPVQIAEPNSAERASPASFAEVELPQTPPRASGEGLDGRTDFPPLEVLPPLSPPTGPAADSPLSPAALDRLREIRQQLEDLGAQYILLETTDGTGQYRFHCQMQLSESSPYAREFEATGSDPLAAAERVLADAGQWRLAALNKEKESDR